MTNNEAIRKAYSMNRYEKALRKAFKTFNIKLGNNKYSVILTEPIEPFQNIDVELWLYGYGFHILEIDKNTK